MTSLNKKEIDQEEKKRCVYSREVLLGYQFVRASMERPKGLPLISEVVLEPCRFQQDKRTIVLREDVQLNKAENAWKPSTKESAHSHRVGDVDGDDPEHAQTQELFGRLRSILNKLTPEKFQELMKQVAELRIDTEERLKGATDLICEKAMLEPNFATTYANMCHHLQKLKVPTSDRPGIHVEFRRLLLNRCQREFEKDRDDDEIFEKKQREMKAAKDDKERERLEVELEEARNKARRRSLGNIKFIGELYKLKMVSDQIINHCIMKLLKHHHDEESLECLCKLLSTVGKNLDSNAKPHMDQYFNQMDKIIKGRKTSSRIRFMLQDTIDLRKNKWVPRRADQGPKTIGEIHKEAEMEEHMEQIEVHQQLLTKKGRGGRTGGNMGGRGPHTPLDKGWKPVAISEEGSIKPIRLTMPSINNIVLAPEGKPRGGSWARGRSRGARVKPAGCPTISNFNLFLDPQPSSSSSRSSQNQISKGSSSSGDRDRRAPTESECRVASGTDDRDSKGFKAEKLMKSAPTPPAPPKPEEMTEEMVEKKAKAIIEEYLHVNDLKEAVLCVTELNSASLLYAFVRSAVESTLDHSIGAREKMGLLLHHLVKAGTLPTQQYYKGLEETLEAVEDMAIDVPHIWLYLAELITPMLHEGGIPMGQLFREISKPLVPLGNAGVLLVQILKLLCKGMTPKTVGALWTEAGLNWRDFLPEDQDVDKFVTDQKVEFTKAEEMEPKEVIKKVCSGEELSKHLDTLLQDKADNQQIIDWLEANLDEQQKASGQFVRTLVTSFCRPAIILSDNRYKVYAMKVRQMFSRARLLRRYLCDEQKQLQVLYALQALVVPMEQSTSLLRMFFDVFYDANLIQEEVYCKWESSKDPHEQTGKCEALELVTDFYAWLREIPQKD